MKNFTIREIENWTEGKLIFGDASSTVRGFEIDSRKMEDTGMFFAIKGSNTDGHRFIKDLVYRGVKNFVISDIEASGIDENLAKEKMLNVVLVENSETALQLLAKNYLNTLPLKHKIGVTGSVGKTSTRDMMYKVAGAGFKTGKNKANYNSETGLPLSILDWDPDTEIAVLEMAMDTFGDIHFLADMVRPDIAIITMITAVNIESMKNLDNILKAKMEITDFFDENSVLVINRDCEILREGTKDKPYRVIGISKESDADYRVTNIKDKGDKGIEFELESSGENLSVDLPVPGAHNAINAGLALAVGEAIGIKKEVGAKALQEVSLTGLRLNVQEKNGVKVINDCYNACEESMKSALRTLKNTASNRKIAVLGDILGLDNISKESHMRIGEFVSELGIDLLLTTGNEGEFIFEGAKRAMGDKAIHFEDKDELVSKIWDFVKEGDTVLIKASRGMRMETVADELLK